MENSESGRAQALSLALLAPILGYVLVRGGIAVVDARLVAGGQDPLFDAMQSQALGAWGALSVGLLVVGDRVTGRLLVRDAAPHPDAPLTGARLAHLPSTFTVLHELIVPGHKGTIGHVVVGPTGLFVIGTERTDEDITVGDGRARAGRRSLARAIDRSRRAASAVSKAAGVPASPVVCVHGASVTVKAGAARPTVDGVRFCAGHELVGLVSNRPEAVSELEVHQIATQLVWRSR